ncbi:1-acylglycerol-3-phosphate O-acyltransferase [Blastocladiella emersonii ATCC 22665]|nr:1-acylglycerol-3-phosphate O-acyltransferase [Blastocladiella emersonii ATCC 22665]
MQSLLSLGVLAYVVLSILARLNVPLVPHRVQFAVKMTHLVGTVGLASTFGMVLGVVIARFFPAHRGDIPFYVGRFFYHTAALALGVRVVVEGFDEYLLDPEFQAVLVANHQDTLDLVVMSAMFPRRCTVMAKKSLGRIPLLGTYLKIAKTFFIDRANSTKDRETMNAAVAEMNREHMSLFVYPEGTRSHRRDRTLLPFKKGAFHVAVQAQVPVVPVVFSAYDDMFDTKHMLFPGGTVHVKILPPIPTAGIDREDKLAIDALVAETRDTMLDTLFRISAPVPGLAAPDTPAKRDRRRKSVSVPVAKLAVSSAQIDTLVMDQRLDGEEAYLDNFSRSASPANPAVRDAENEMRARRVSVASAAAAGAGQVEEDGVKYADAD